MVAPFKASVGLRRIPSTSRESIEAITRETRDAMQGIIKDIKAWSDHMHDQMPEILVEALKPTFEKSQGYVPVKTGDLKKSGYLRTRQLKTRTIAEVGYALGGRPFYGVFVHEDLQAFHQPPTRAKFLQAALEEDSDQIERRIRDLLGQAAGV